MNNSMFGNSLKEKMMNMGKNRLMKSLLMSFAMWSVFWLVCLPVIVYGILWIGERLDFQWLYNINMGLYWSIRFFRDTIIDNYIVMIVSAMLVYFFIEINLMYRMLKKALKYIEMLSDAAEKIFSGDVEYIEMPNELYDFQQKMNHIRRESEESRRMAGEAEKRKNDLVIYLAHDLKTPLTSVIGYLTLLHDEKDISRSLQEKYLGIALDKALRLEDLINEFFEITRFNLTHINLEPARVNLTLFLQQMVYEFKPMMAEKNLRIELNAEPEIMISCDAGKMQRVFDNLLRNAVNYSFENGVIFVIAEKCSDAAGKDGNEDGNKDGSEDAVKIRFVNRGNTIPPEKLARIFEQFYRVDSSRSSGSGNSGLGLAISKQIVELHGGRISAKSENSTVEFEVVLPLQKI